MRRKKRSERNKDVYEYDRESGGREERERGFQEVN
jgi:hypothetical protein